MHLVKKIEEYEIADSLYFTFNNKKFSADIKGKLSVKIGNYKEVTCSLKFNASGELSAEIGKRGEVTCSLKISNINVRDSDIKEAEYISRILMRYQDLIKVSFKGDYLTLYIDENELNKRIKNGYREDH